MKLRRPLVALVAAALSLLPTPATAQDRRVVVFLVGGLSYEEAISTPVLRSLAERGGIGLMVTPSHDPRDNSGYLSLGAGGVVDGSVGRVVPPVGRAGSRLDLERYVGRQGGGTPGALAEALARAQVPISYAPQDPEDEPGLLMVAEEDGTIPRSPIGVEDPAGQPGLVVFDLGRMDLDQDATTVSISTGLFLTGMAPGDRLLVVVTSPAPASSMVERGDLAPALIVAEMSGAEIEDLPLVLLRSRIEKPGEAQKSSGMPAGLTSDATRRPGIVSVADVAPTILDFLGVPIPPEMDGAPVRVAGEAPTDLHDRFLEYRRVRVPIQVGMFAVAAGVFLMAAALLFLPSWGRVRQVVGFLGTAVACLPVVLLPVGFVPQFSYAVLVPSVAGGALLAAALAWRRGRDDPAGPLVAVAWLALALLVLEAALGWPGMVMSLLGGSSLEGGRFYGMPNTFAGLLLAASVLAATRLPAVWGTLLLLAAAALGGAPGLGANLGAGVTLAAAAGLWWGTGRRERPGVRALAAGAAAAAAGLLVLLLWHRLAPGPTHVTRIVAEAERSGLGALFDVALRRLGILARTTSRVPAMWLAVAGLPVAVAIAWKGAGPFRAILEGDPSWRRGVIVLAMSGMVGFLANDTSSTAAVAFGYVAAALILPSLEARRPSLEARWTEPTPTGR